MARYGSRVGDKTKVTLKESGDVEKGTEGKLALHVESPSRMGRLNTPLGAVTILTGDDQPGRGSRP